MRVDDPSTAGLELYLVGGAVRDRLLGRAQRDRDYVVVGSTPEAMIARGFRPVGADFPVFLHPRTQQEYALARTERKSGRGYVGFVFHTGAEVGLEDDLRRRDFTINAIAQAADGRLVDPFDGQGDLQRRLLRHVAPAFAEDPLRVLRAARFMARFAPLGFAVAPETLELMRRMVADGEVDHLVPERIWQELRRALIEARPSAFLQTLRACGALARLFPEVDALYGVPQRAEFHPEVDTGAHLELVLDQCPRLAPDDDQVAWAAFVHDLGKALTPKEELPRHLLHERRGVPPARALAARLKIPAEHRELGALVCEQHLVMHRFAELRPASVMKLLERLDGLRKPDRVRRFALACEADHRGRLGMSERPYPQGARLLAALTAARTVDAEPLLERGLAGRALGEVLRKRRIEALAQALETA
ncbi:MAG: multifunctional CCA addition/repair protein [Xanthomonadales bacterium]|nr:Multifunctional CCA protein [Xanthomonadales bacterium]MCC6593920.1 multifunctional CCA addition/repair protein [Xanthomonadales bacterium]MCE7932058.1 multifunctional CCA addition/repair protein [Xanthomonadales bacterium PRO6]